MTPKPRPKPPTLATAEPVKMEKFAIPKKWGDVADLMYSLKEEEARVKAALEASPLARQLAEIQARRSKLDEHVIENMSKSAGEGATGHIGHVEVYTKPIPTVDTQNDGWGKLYEYIKKKNAFHLLAKSLSTGAINEMLDAGEKLPPGVITYNQVKVSLTKAKKR